MKKNSFIEGAMIATIGIIICRIIGLVYVIPFYAIIGTQGGTLYSYAYSIYAVFLSLSLGGIPIAMSKVISEYNALGYYNTKERTYKIGKLIIMGIGFVCFVFLMIFADKIAYLIIGDAEGGNTIEGIGFVIRVVATALLIVPSLSVTKGYLEGHKFITQASISSVLEQLIRVLVIIFGSFMALKVFNLSIETAVGIAVFGATAGAIVAYFYIMYKIRKNKDKLNRGVPKTREEAKITTKDIAKKIIFYALPFVAIDLIKSAYSMVDTFTVVKTMTNIGYNMTDTETVFGVISNWATKLNMIVISIAIGLTISLVPNIASSFVKKDMVEVNHKINQSLQALLFTTLPMAAGLSFLAGPVWVIFYGYNAISIDVFTFFVWQTITFSFFSILIDITQTMNNTKLALGTLLASFIGKALLNIPLMYFCDLIGVEAYYGSILATLLTQALAILFIVYRLRKEYQLRYRSTINNFIKTILCTSIMIVSLLILKQFINIDVTTRMSAIMVTALFAIIGAVIYMFAAYRSNLINDIFGENLINKIMIKLRLKKQL